MCVDEFMDGKMVISVSDSDSFADLDNFQSLLEERFDRRVGWNYFANGFAGYCRRILEYVWLTREAHEVEVYYNRAADYFEYMDTKGWFNDRGLEVATLVECLDELESLNYIRDVTFAELESVIA